MSALPSEGGARFLSGSNFTLKTLIKLARALEAHVHVNFDREVELSEAAAERYRRWEAQDICDAIDHASRASDVLDPVDDPSDGAAGSSLNGLTRIVQQYGASDIGFMPESQLRDLPLLASHTELVSSGRVTMEAVGEGS